MNLVAAAALLLVSNGRWMIPAAAWLAPVFLLRFVRGPRAAMRLLIGGVVVYVIECVAWRGMVPVPGLAYYAILLGVALVPYVPYVVDRLVAPRLSGFVSTLVFPCAWAGIEFLNGLASPYGSWGAAAYTQSDQLPLLQMVSVTGLWGVGFVIAWFAAVANWAWARGFEWERIRSGTLVFAMTMALIGLFGGARLAFAPAPARIVRVASFTATPSRLVPDDLLSRPRQGATLDSVRALLLAHEDTLFAWSRREARAGARIVFWSEANLFVLKSDETRVRARGAAFARDEGIHLLMAMAVFTPGKGFYENEIVAFDPSGLRLGGYHKARPVPGDPERGADREIPVFDTALGRVAGAICFDMDFPGLIRRAGRERAELILAPSSDWRAIDPIHTRMALLRGVENGCAVVRQTNKGLSAAGDPYGRLVAQADYFQTRPDVMVSQVPMGRVATGYSKIGDLFAYLGLAGLGLLVIAAIRRPARADG